MVFLTESVLTGAAEELSDIQKTLSDLPLRTILTSLALLVICIVVVHLIVKVADRLMQRSKLDSSLYRFIRSLLRVLLYFVSILLVATSLGINVTSLVALFSVLSLAISLAVQNVLSNVAGGVMLTGAKPFREGDYIRLEDLEGTVDEVTMVYTKLHTIDNRKVMIPNRKVSDTTIVNFSARGKRRLELEISASYDSPPETAMAALRRAAERVGGLPEEPILVEFQDFGESAIVYHVCIWIDPKDYLDKRYLLRRRIWEEFQAAGVKMTYPHLNVHVDKP